MALPVIDETRGGESDEEEEGEPPEFDQEEQNLLDEQRLEMQRDMVISDQEWSEETREDELVKQLLEDQKDPKKQVRINQRWQTVDGLLYRKGHGVLRRQPGSTIRAYQTRFVHSRASTNPT